MAGGQARDSVPRKLCNVRSEIADRAEAIRLLWLLEGGEADQPREQGRGCLKGFWKEGQKVELMQPLFTLESSKGVGQH